MTIDRHQRGVFYVWGKYSKVHQGYAMYFTTTGRFIRHDCAVPGRPTTYLCTRKEGPERGMCLDEVQGHQRDIHLILQDWDPDWKVPVNKTETKHSNNKEEEYGDGQGSGWGNIQVNDVENTQQTIPKAREKRKYKGKVPTIEIL
jgi:hypothetical protein